MGEQESGMRREELVGWLEEVARQLRTGTLMIDGEKVSVPGKMKSRTKTKDKKGRGSLELRLEWEKDKKAGEALPGNGNKVEQKPQKEEADAKDGSTAKVRDYDSHVFICSGGDCKKRGSKGLRKALRSELGASGIFGDIRVDNVDCLGLCKHGPNITVYPEGTWYLGLKEADVPEVVEQHLKGGAPVERLAADRRPRKAKKAKQR